MCRVWELRVAFREWMGLLTRLIVLLLRMPVLHGDAVCPYFAA